MASEDPQQSVCPRCGEPATSKTFCGSCGLNLRLVDRLPSQQEFEAQQREKAWLERKSEEREAVEIARREEEERAEREAENHREAAAALRSASAPKPRPTVSEPAKDNAGKTSPNRRRIVVAAVVAIVIAIAIAAALLGGGGSDPSPVAQAETEAASPTTTESSSSPSTAPATAADPASGESDNGDDPDNPGDCGTADAEVDGEEVSVEVTGSGGPCGEILSRAVAYLETGELPAGWSDVNCGASRASCAKGTESFSADPVKNATATADPCDELDERTGGFECSDAVEVAQAALDSGDGGPNTAVEIRNWECFVFPYAVDCSKGERKFSTKFGSTGRQSP